MMHLGQLVKIGHLRCNNRERMWLEREMCNLEEVYLFLLYLVWLYLPVDGRCFFFCFYHFHLLGRMHLSCV